jgi:hypothetical protein
MTEMGAHRSHGYWLKKGIKHVACTAFDQAETCCADDGG